MQTIISNNRKNMQQQYFKILRGDSNKKIFLTEKVVRTLIIGIILPLFIDNIFLSKKIY